MLLAYLIDRLVHNQSLHAESPVIAPNARYATRRGKNYNKIFLPTRRISKDIRETFRPRFNWRPYILRAYFDTELLVAESRGMMAHDFRVFFMGHKGHEDKIYHKQGNATRDIVERDAGFISALTRLAGSRDVR